MGVCREGWGGGGWIVEWGVLTAFLFTVTFHRFEHCDTASWEMSMTENLLMAMLILKKSNPKNWITVDQCHSTFPGHLQTKPDASPSFPDRGN